MGKLGAEARIRQLLAQVKELQGELSAANTELDSLRARAGSSSCEVQKFVLKLRQHCPDSVEALLDVPFKPHVMQALMQIPCAAQVVSHLAANPNLVADLLRIEELEAVRALWRLNAALEASIARVQAAQQYEYLRHQHFSKAK